MHFIFDSLFKNEFCFDLPLFAKYPATSINSYFYNMTLVVVVLDGRGLDCVRTLFVTKNIGGKVKDIGLT